MIKKIIFALAVIITASSLYAEPAKNANVKKDKLHVFPQAKEGFVRYVIEVPKTENDYDHKVELRIGKNMMVDCNHHSFEAEIKSVTVKGWGYQYLEVGEIRSGPTTMMFCPAPKKEMFIAIRDTLRRYNSRSPMVVYVQEGYEVRYRVWSAEKTHSNAIER